MNFELIDRSLSFLNQVEGLVDANFLDDSSIISEAE